MQEQIKSLVLTEIIKHDQVTESEHVEIDTFLMASNTEGRTWKAFARYCIRRSAAGFPIVGAVEAYVDMEGKASCLWFGSMRS